MKDVKQMKLSVEGADVEIKKVVLPPALPEETSSGRNMVSMAGCYHDLAGPTISPATWTTGDDP